MTVDKPPLALWIQALSVRVFGFDSLAMLVPEALMGVAAVGLTYDLVRRRFGRAAGFAAGLVLALTPIMVAISRHNNPDEADDALLGRGALVLQPRAGGRPHALARVRRGQRRPRLRDQDGGRAVHRPRHRARLALGRARRSRGCGPSFGQLLWGGLAMAAVGLAWPLLVWLTPAADRPWVSGTADNSIWSLIVGYNGVGRVAGQAGTPATAAVAAVAAAASRRRHRCLPAAGPALGDQGGWLIGFALVSGLGLLVLTRLRRARSAHRLAARHRRRVRLHRGRLLLASGIFHPYYVSLLAPSIGAARRRRGRGGAASRHSRPA